MAFSDSDKAEISQIVVQALEQDFERRRRLRMEADIKHEASKVTKLYLITMLHHQIAFPDERGRSILNQTFYARMTLDQSNPHFYGGAVEVIAYGDGQLLAAPMRVILTGSSMSSLCEVPDDYLERLSKNSAALVAA